MQAITYKRYGSPDVLELEELPTPKPGPRDIRVRVHAAAVNHADTTFRQGPLLIRLFNGLLRPRRPVLGTELAGVIDAVGAEVTRFAVGDAVFAATGAEFGAHAEYVCLPEGGAVAPMPTGLTWAEAVSLCESALTALPFLRDEGGLQPGQRVLINGASGAVGSGAVQIAKHLGARVTAVCSAGNAELVRSLGADEVLDYVVTDFTTLGRTWDLVFDVAGKSSFPRVRPVLAAGGTYLCPVMGPGIAWYSLWTRWFGSRRAKIAFTGLREPAVKAADLRLVNELVAAGKLRPVVGHRFAVAEAGEAHRLVESGHKRGGAVLDFAA